MTAGTYAQDAPPGGHQAAPNNPALNPDTFQRAWAQAAPTERAGMTVAGTYIKTAALLIILFGAASYGWSQVEIVEVRGVPVAVQPAWTWLLLLLTLAWASSVQSPSVPLGSSRHSMRCRRACCSGIAADFFNLEYEGIVLQAIVATFAVLPQR